MKLCSFSIDRYRSISKTSELFIGNYTVLVGQNNEGKTNVFSALNLFFRYMYSYSVGKTVNDNVLVQSRYKYDFATDYPVELINKKDSYIESHPTIIRLSFAFSDKEKEDFKKMLKLTYNAPIMVELSLSKTKAHFHVLKRRINDAKKRELIKFVYSRIKATFVPTIRTSHQSMEIIENLVYNSLDSLKNDSEYNEAYQVLQQKEDERLQEISNNLKPYISNFISNIKDVGILFVQDRSSRFFDRSIDLTIDDGVLTSIENKGDGIKSLVQMALLKETSKNSDGLIMIEEPESHLHSGAIHELNSVLREVSKKQQVIITTHNPIFIDRLSVKSNIIVSHGMCHHAKSIKELRDTLGVEFSDSMFCSDYVVLVEGESDKILFQKLLSDVSPKFEKLIINNKIQFYKTNGASKSKTFMLLFQQLLINYYCIWDGDQAGQKAFDEANKSSLLKDENYFIIPTLGKKEAELEDILNQKKLKDFVENEYHIVIDETKNKKQKWSNRIQYNMRNNGKNFSSDDEENLKDKIANKFCNENFNEIVNPAYNGILKSLADSILAYFDLQ